MSKRINVNPGQYKVAGRERPGDDLPEPERSPTTNAHDDNEARERWEKRQERQREDESSKE